MQTGAVIRSREGAFPPSYEQVSVPKENRNQNQTNQKKKCPDPTNQQFDIIISRSSHMIQIQRSFYKLDFPRERRQGPWHSPREPRVGSKEDLEGKQSGEGLRGHRVAALPHAAPQGPGTSHTRPGTGTVLQRWFFTQPLQTQRGQIQAVLHWAHMHPLLRISAQRKPNHICLSLLPACY